MSNGMIPIEEPHRGIDGILEEGKEGFFCTPGDLEKLSQLLRNLLSGNLSDLIPDVLTRIAELTREKVASDYLHFIERVANERGRRADGGAHPWMGGAK
jgi:hypothetical protein